jgi:hypothetical protein
MTGQQIHKANAQQSYTFASPSTCPDPSGSPSIPLVAGQKGFHHSHADKIETVYGSQPAPPCGEHL